jgi:hypothetical protein
LLALIKEEKEYIKDKLKLKLMGWVSDASGGVKGCACSVAGAVPTLNCSRLLCTPSIFLHGLLCSCIY